MPGPVMRMLREGLDRLGTIKDLCCECLIGLRRCCFCCLFGSKHNTKYPDLAQNQVRSHSILTF